MRSGCVQICSGSPRTGRGSSIGRRSADGGGRAATPADLPPTLAARPSPHRFASSPIGGRRITCELPRSRAWLHVVSDPDGSRHLDAAGERTNGDVPADLRMTIAGANPTRASPVRACSQDTVNYVRGHDRKTWLTDIPTYARVRSHGVYPGIDLVYHNNGLDLEYDFVVAPGAEPGGSVSRSPALTPR